MTNEEISETRQCLEALQSFLDSSRQVFTEFQGKPYDRANVEFMRKKLERRIGYANDKIYPITKWWGHVQADHKAAERSVDSIPFMRVYFTREVHNSVIHLEGNEFVRLLMTGHITDLKSEKEIVE